MLFCSEETCCNTTSPIISELSMTFLCSIISNGLATFGGNMDIIDESPVRLFYMHKASTVYVRTYL